MVATAGPGKESGGIVALGLEAGMAVQELGWDSDVDEAVRDAMMDAIDADLLEDPLEAVDAVALWWRADDGDVADGLVDALLRTARFGRREREMRDEALALLERMNLADRAHDKAGSLPYGDQRRLEIARALATHPKVLLLDEPAAGMNPAEVDELVELIRGIAGDFGLTVLLIEHQMGLVMNLCERLVVLDFGEVIAKGTPGEIQRNPRVLEAYLGKGVV